MTSVRLATASGSAPVSASGAAWAAPQAAPFSRRCVPGFLVSLLLFVFLSFPLFAANSAAVSGTITDSLGAVVANAKVVLLDAQSGRALLTTTSDAAGHYRFAIDRATRYSVRAEAASFRSVTSDALFLTAASSAQIDLTLAPAVVSQQVVVSATGMPTPEVQTGASIAVLTARELSGRRTLEQEMRLAPGLQLSSTGQPGAQTALRVRGGATDATKVLIDGVPANDIGGFVDLATLASTGLAKIEVFRGPNSALFGSDAMAGVVNVTTRRGATPLPELAYQADGGSFGAYRQESSLGGAWRKFDYFTAASFFQTRNDVSNSQAHNNSYLANLGWQLTPGMEVRATARRSVSATNSPNAWDLYHIADTGVSREADTAFGVTVQNRFSERWHSLVRYAGLRYREGYTSNGASGIAYDPWDTGYPSYLGKVVTIKGANGYSATGQAILQYSNDVTQSPALSNKDSLYAQTDYRFSEMLTALVGFRYESEDGYTAYLDPASYYNTLTRPGQRQNYSTMLQLSGGAWDRLFYTVGSGLEHNAVYGFAATPRASLAVFAAKPRESGFFNGTRFSFNFGKGIKEPTLGQQANSMYSLAGATLDAQYNLQPFRAEQARTFDGGIQQTLAHGRLRLSLTYFHNEFSHQAEYVPYAGLLALGIPKSVAAVVGPYGGAYSNSLAYRAQGTELEGEVHLLKNLALRAGWAYTDALVQNSFSSSALSPAVNPAFPSIKIGAYSPLVGARPFRVAPNTGTLSAEYSAGKLMLRLAGSFVSRRDDSTFLSDPDYGYSMLLPNRNLDSSYQKLDFYGSYRFSSRLSAYATVDNLLNQRYYEVFGYPSLPVAVRTGISIRLGGESWKLR